MNLLDLFVKIGVQDEASAPVKKIAGAIGKGFAAAVKVGTAAIGATATGLGILGKQALSAYADYEQLVGGIKKLYGDGTADQLLKYASQAYETAGMSANQYMQNVTGFSAALINSLGGDTERAAEIANMAMKDISDNANTFGKYTAEELAGVYQALAKGQYQTLDNLNLGFGGTKEGMQGLIDKANELRKAQGETADLTIDSYADIVQAIHEVQKEMGIMDATMNEAKTTISGSFNQLKASWQNFLAGLGNSDADLSGLIDNLIQSASTVLQNVKPVALQIVTGLATAIQEAAPIIADVLPQIAVELIPPLISAAATLVGALVKALPGILSAVWDGIKAVGAQFLPVLESVFGGVAGWFGEKFQAAKAAVQAAFQSIGDFFAGVWADIVGVFQDAKNIGVNVVNDILSGIQSVWDSIVSWVSGAWDKVKSFFTIDVSFLGGGKSHAIGNDYVPYNNYPALLHRGEAVLTAREADEWRRGKGSNGSGITNVFNFHGVSQSDLDYIVAYVNRGLA